MEIIRSKDAMLAFSNAQRKNGKSIGFVPTMGALHSGHISLVQQSRKDADVTVVSIFVNPTQFGKGEDFEVYPRDVDTDTSSLNDEGVDILYYPSVEDVYPAGTTYNLDPLPDIYSQLEGKHRPTHFFGVAQVVKILFEYVIPEHTYFGQKDYQQCLLIRWLIKQYSLPIDLHIMPILRENDGLAMSSRNKYLSPEDKKLSPLFSEAMNHVKKIYDQGEKYVSTLERELLLYISKCDRLKIDYAVIRNRNDLSEMLEVDSNGIILVGGRLGNTRLIDNMYLV